MKGRKERRTSLPQPHLVRHCSIKIDGEEIRLGSKSPLRTVLLLSVGPLISQTVQALYGVVNLFWVSKALGDIGIEVFGAVYVVDFITLGFADYLMTALDIRVSYLFGQKAKVEECSQIYVDFLRFAVLFGLLMPAIILPISRPLIEWFGSDKEISLMCFHYLFPTTFGAPINFIFMISCGLIQSEGHSILFGISQVASLVLNMGCFGPLFLLGFRLPIWGASLATLCSEGLVSTILVILIFSGKFTIKPEFKMFCRKFSKESIQALRIGVASLLEDFSYSVPEIMIQKYLNAAAKHIGKYDTIIKVWGVIEKLYQFVGGSNDAFAIGLLPAASYAFGACRYNRMLRLFMHANWITILISVVYSIFLIFIPHKIAQIWSSDPDYLHWATLMIPKVFYGNFCFPIEYTVPALLQGMQKVKQATFLATLTSILPIPLFSSILYFTNKNDPARIMWTYLLSDCFAFLMCSAFISPSLVKLCKEPKDETIFHPNPSIGESKLAKSSLVLTQPLIKQSSDMDNIDSEIHSGLDSGQS